MSVASQMSIASNLNARAVLRRPFFEFAIFAIASVSLGALIFVPSLCIAGPTYSQSANNQQGNPQKKKPTNAAINLRAPALTISGTEPPPRQAFKPIKLTAPLLTIAGTEPPPRGVFYPMKIIAPSLTVSGQSAQSKKE